jgi:hypothetical protein
MRKMLLIGIFGFAQLLSFGAANAGEVVFDGITPQTNSTIPVSIGVNTTSKYGFGFVAGASRTLTQVEIIVTSAISSGKIAGYLYQNDSNGASGTGTYVGVFTQSATATAYSGLTNQYLLKLSGSAKLVAGKKYWIYFICATYSGNELNVWGSTTPTVSTDWSIITSGLDYVLINNSNAFNYQYYPITKLILSISASISVSLTGGSNVAIYRRTSQLRAAVDSDGPVTFFANNKKINGCTSITSSSGVAVCSWKPSIHGRVSISARVIPNDVLNYEANTSSAISINTVSRSNAR